MGDFRRERAEVGLRRAAVHPYGDALSPNTNNPEDYLCLAKARASGSRRRPEIGVRSRKALTPYLQDERLTDWMRAVQAALVATAAGR